MYFQQLCNNHVSKHTLVFPRGAAGSGSARFKALMDFPFVLEKGSSLLSLFFFPFVGSGGGLMVARKVSEGGQLLSADHCSL